MELKEIIYRSRGELCEYCGEPTSILLIDLILRGAICQCDWKFKRFKAFNESQQKRIDELEAKLKWSEKHRQHLNETIVNQAKQIEQLLTKNKKQ